MSYRIAIASGKGGTGKTTVSLNIYQSLRKTPGAGIVLADCDVEEPNDILFFPDAVKTDEREVFQLIPEIDKEKCSFCRKCVSYCEFNAIVIIPSAGFAEVNKSLCHSCGACLVACDENAITERQESIGKISTYNSEDGLHIAEGNLKIGSAMQTMLIKELKKKVKSEEGIILFDAPPGTSCPVVETVSDADYIVLVTEPTPFGLHDLKLMVELLSEMHKDFGVIINKSGLGDRLVYDYLQENDIELIGEIPFSEEYASAYSKAELFNHVPPEIEDSYIPIIEKLSQKIRMHEGNNHIER